MGCFKTMNYYLYSGLLLQAKVSKEKRNSPYLSPPFPYGRKAFGLRSDDSAVLNLYPREFSVG
jgi:hypothetical protein